MRILAVADKPAPRYYDYYTPGRFDGINLIVACGDLPREYLEFLVTMSNKPLFYVRGNHDDSFAEEPPEGCVCIDGRIETFRGVRFLGLGGSYRYRDGRNMYTEQQMAGRIRRLWLPLRRSGGFDVLVAHAPARHINDTDAPAHRGFACFNALIEKYRPALFLHGHIHKNYGRDIPQRSVYGGTEVINAYEYCIVELPDKA